MEKRMRTTAGKGGERPLGPAEIRLVEIWIDAAVLMTDGIVERALAQDANKRAELMRLTRAARKQLTSVTRDIRELLGNHDATARLPRRVRRRPSR